jgi:hypothetical protein
LAAAIKYAVALGPGRNRIENQKLVQRVKKNTYMGRDQDPDVHVLPATIDGQLWALYDISPRTVQGGHLCSLKKEVKIEVLR